MRSSKHPNVNTLKMVLVMILLVVEGPFLSAYSSGANETPTIGPSPTATMVQLAKLFPDVADYIQRGDYDNAIRALDRKIADKPA
jgi:hypothetical protein